MLQHVQIGGGKTLNYSRKKGQKRLGKYQATYLQGRNLILKTTEHIRRKIYGLLKFTLHWERPFVINEAYRSGYYYLTSVKQGMLTEPINAKWLKSNYC
ncbi:S ribonuclease [Pyrus ussuriensis x Pyrus communis]|uniref:S ribonuclease n=1 Tax=Pyrus ussuriensis x Pyrus communis TaxID=2448454 RepID=A0A5N5FHM8_9ROSA|nr:S ribonuclease [Pyrus ussuriensis x Pyrus communis]